MNPRFGDVYRWAETKYKAMYVGPGQGKDGWTGVVLCNDDGDAESFFIGKDWVEAGVSEPAPSTRYSGYWEKVE